MDLRRAAVAHRMADPQDQISLASTLATSAIQTVSRTAVSVSISILVDTATYSWGSAVVTLQWSNTNDEYADWQAYSPTITFSSSTTARRNIPAAGVRYLRLATTTANGASDPEAEVTWVFT